MRLDGRFLKLESIPTDRLVEGLPIAAALDDLLVVSWSEAAPGGPGIMSIVMQLLDLAGDPVEEEHAVRFTCDTRATMTVGATGTALSGDGTDDLISTTGALGTVELLVACGSAIVVSLAAGATQASPMLDCRALASVSFIP